MSTSSLLQSAPHDGADNTCQQPTAAGVDQSRLNFLLRHLVRCREVLEAGLAMLKPEHFTVPEEEIYRAAWAAAMDCYHRSDWPPAEATLRWGMVGRLAKDREDRLRLGQDSRIAQLISTILADGDDEGSFNVELALDVLHAFVKERERVEQPSPDQDGRHVEGQRTDRSAGEDNQQGEMQGEPAAHSADGPTLPVRWARTPRTPISTGVPMLDDRMDGGSEPGDVNVILAPPGTEVTAMGIQILVSAARLSLRSEIADADQGKLHVHIGNEGYRPSHQILAAANAARVKRARLSQIGHDSELSTMDSLLDYDHEVAGEFESSAGRVLGETERIEVVRPWMDRLVWFVDVEGLPAKIDGKDEHVWVHRIRHDLDALRSENGREIGHVVIDSATDVLLQERWEETQDRREAMNRELLDFVSLVREHIAKPLECVVWVIHGLVDGSRTVPAHVLPEDRFADRCPTFAGPARYIFVLGNKHGGNGTLLLHCTKTPEGRCSHVTICKSNYDFAEFVSADEEYYLDEERKGIFPRSGRRNRSARTRR